VRKGMNNTNNRNNTNNTLNKSSGVFSKVIRRSCNCLSLPTLRNIQVRTILTLAVALSVIVIYQSGLLIDADALTRYYNCTTRVANKNDTLSLQNVDNCYDNVFKGAKAAEKELQALKIETGTGIGTEQTALTTTR
jgi:hypothetical protein